MKPPIYTGVKKFISKQRIMFTTPGHNGKVILNSRNFCKLDAASNFETDNLDTPGGYIVESEYKLAKLYDTYHSYYITNGTSCGIMAMIASVLSPGDKIIVDRACHKSVIDAITICRLVPVFVTREFNEELGFFGGIDTYNLESVMSANRDAKALFVTSPTYYGVISDVEEIADLTYKYNMLLLVDESHGAHLPFASELPKSALYCGADMVLHNAGETLGSMSGGAVLHINNETINKNKVRRIVYTYQTPDTSNAYLCALENSIYYASSRQKRYSGLINEIDRCKSVINGGTDIIWFETDEQNEHNIFANDKTRIVINFARIGLSGKEASDILRLRFGLEPEMADENNVVLVASLFNSSRDIRKLMTALIYIYKQFLKKKIGPLDEIPVYQFSNNDIVLASEPGNTMRCPSEWVEARDVEGRICKSTIYTYPTYFPLIIPGERITRKHLQSMDLAVQNGERICGLSENGEFEVVNMTYSYMF